MDAFFVDTILYDITMNCNLRCKHCYNADLLEEPEYVEANIHKIISAFSKIRANSIVIQGGEPLMVSNLENLIEEFNKRNISVFVTTNATLLTSDRIVKILKSGLKGIFFSIESASAIVNDQIRGKGTFYSFITNVKNFMNLYIELVERKYISPLRPALSCTVSSINFKTKQDIVDMFCLAKELKIKDIKFNFLQNFGACKNLCYNENTTNFELANKIAKISLSFPDICIQLPTKQIEQDVLKNKYGTNLNIHGAKGSCPAGDKVAYVDNNLNILPCSWLLHINKDSLFTKRNMVDLNDKINLKMFESFLEYKKECLSTFEDCLSCKYKGSCIPICPCVKKLAINERVTTKYCPTKKEIREFYE